MSVSQRASSVTNHAAEYFRKWCVRDPRSGDVKVTAGLMLLVAGVGPARVPTCEHALEHASCDASYLPLLLRALSLLGPGELRALRVTEPMLLHVVLSKVGPSEAGLFDELRTVAWTGYNFEIAPAFAFIERHAETLIELDGRMVNRCEAGDQALARCTRLETLTHACHYAPAVWLGLSQLHTLRGVDPAQAPLASIAAALPRLHTLGVNAGYGVESPAAVAGFFEDLLPRLRAFHFDGKWPLEQPTAVGTVPAPLPLLQELEWKDASPHPDTARKFMGARPVVLRVSFGMLSHWLTAADEAGFSAGTKGSDSPLTCARLLSITIGPPTSSDVARILRAAPQLRHFIIGGIRDLTWLTAFELPTCAPFVGLVHHNVRRIEMPSMGGVPATTGTAFPLLRASHFPRLQRILIGQDLHYRFV